MTLPPIISCFIKIQIGLTLIVPTYPSCPGKESIKRVSVCFLLFLLLEIPQSRPHWHPSPRPASLCVQCEHAHLYHSASAPGWLTTPTLTTPTVTGQPASPSPTTLWFYNGIDVCVCYSKYFVRRGQRMTLLLSCVYRSWHVSTVQLMLCRPSCPSLLRTPNPSCRANSHGLWLATTRCSFTSRNCGYVQWFCSVVERQLLKLKL